MSDGPLADVVERAQLEERRRALRALLRRPLLRARGRDARDFALVRRHAPLLRDWLHRETGWQLVVDPEFARLRKLPADDVVSARAAVDERSGRPFNRRRYVLLCLALAALERSDAQVALARLADDVLAAAAAPRLAATGFRFGLETRDERTDLVAAVRLLLELGVLCRIDGDEQDFVDASGDALYDVDRRVLAVLHCYQRGPSTLRAISPKERLGAISEELVLDTGASRTRAVRHRLTRRLLDDPVVFDTDLSDEELSYLQTQRAATARRITEATGLEPELRAEGMAMLDPTGEATDLVMPEEGTHGHATLLLAEHLADQARREPGSSVPLETLREHAAGLVKRHGHRWRKQARESGGHLELCERALNHLEALGLIQRTEDGVLARPAMCRYAVDEPTLPPELVGLEPSS